MGPEKGKKEKRLKPLKGKRGETNHRGKCVSASPSLRGGSDQRRGSEWGGKKGEKRVEHGKGRELKKKVPGEGGTKTNVPVGVRELMGGEKKAESQTDDKNMAGVKQKDRKNKRSHICGQICEVKVEGGGQQGLGITRLRDKPNWEGKISGGGGDCKKNRSSQLYFGEKREIRKKTKVTWEKGFYGMGKNERRSPVSPKSPRRPPNWETGEKYGVGRGGEWRQERGANIVKKKMTIPPRQTFKRGGGGRGNRAAARNGP